MCIREQFSAAGIKFPQSIKISAASGPTVPPFLMSALVLALLRLIVCTVLVNGDIKYSLLYSKSLAAFLMLISYFKHN